MFKEVVEYLGEDVIERSTQKDMNKKQEKQNSKKQRQLEQANAKKLEKLFEYKLETFEIPEIKESKNRALKSKLRRSKSIPEVNLWAMVIVKEALDNEEKGE